MAWIGKLWPGLSVHLKHSVMASSICQAFLNKHYLLTRKETRRCDKSRMCPDHPRRAIPTKDVMWGAVGTVNYAKFCQIWLRGFGSLRGHNLSLFYA